MDFTLSNGYVTHLGTGQRMHEQAQAVPTAVGDKDHNSVLWSLMEVVKAAGLTGVQFDKDTPATYQRLRNAINRLVGNNYTFINAAASPYAITADNAGLVAIDATAGNVVVNLPLTTVLPNMKLEFLRTDSTANTVTINRAGAETIDGATSFTLSEANSGRTIRSNNGGGVWRSPLNSDGVLSTNGWCRLPNGLILQWGSVTFPASGLTTSAVVPTLPITFPKGILLACTVIPNRGANTVDGRIPTNGITAYTSSTLTLALDCLGVSTFNQTVPAQYFCIGK